MLDAAGCVLFESEKIKQSESGCFEQFGNSILLLEIHPQTSFQISTFHNLDYDNIDEFWKNLFNDTKIPQHNESTSDSTLNASGESCLTNNFVCKSNNFSIFQCSESASLKKMLMSTAEKSNKRMQLEFKDNRIQNMEVQIDLLQDECAALEETVEKLKAKIDE